MNKQKTHSTISFIVWAMYFMIFSVCFCSLFVCVRVFVHPFPIDNELKSVHVGELARNLNNNNDDNAKKNSNFSGNKICGI